ncbi:MAG: NFACT family protein, partial [Clostridia bacterium]|nr:NFACT family protein [Clostridia bacterium]
GGEIVEFSYMELRQYGNSAENRKFDSFSILLDTVYSKRDAKARISQQAQQLSKLLSAAKGRALRKLDYRRQDLAKCAAKEDLRIKGELLKANLHLVQPGAKSVRVQNYYDPELREITINIKEDLSPAANASLFFKDYKKLCNAEKLLGRLIDSGLAELEYIESVSDALLRAESAADLGEIRAELEATGYIRRASKGRKNAPVGKPKEYKSPDGFKILVGRNNIQNEVLTFKTASKQDMWFHVKDFPGAHTIVFSDGREIPESTLLYAAKLTAANTAKTALSSSVAVDYTLVKRVKKQAGGKPGMVFYTDQKTLYVTPERDM